MPSLLSIIKKLIIEDIPSIYAGGTEKTLQAYTAAANTSSITVCLASQSFTKFAIFLASYTVCQWLVATTTARARPTNCGQVNMTVELPLWQKIIIANIHKVVIVRLQVS